MLRRIALSTLLFFAVVVSGFAAGSRQVVTRTKPVYPELAKRMNVQGTVKMKAVVGADGKVKSVSLVNGNPILFQAAQTAVKQWVYASGAEETVEVEVNFSNAE